MPTLTKAQARLLNRSDLEQAANKFASACSYSRQHQDEAITAIRRYGDQGPQISGCVREHFPEDIKNQLRLLAFLVTEMSEAGYSFRPKGVRKETMVQLAQAVATRDGSGFYGPQPRRR